MATTVNAQLSMAEDACVLHVDTGSGSSRDVDRMRMRLVRAAAIVMSTPMAASATRDLLQAC